MDLPVLTRLRERHSVRSYSSELIEQSVLDKLQAEISYINTHSVGMHLQMFINDPNPFRGITRSYGMFKGVENYIACVVDTSYRSWQQRLGFNAMQLVMKACSLNIGTCIVGATFDRNNTNARVRVGEDMPIVITFGYPARKESLIASFARKMVHRNAFGPSQLLTTDTPITELSAEIKQGAEAICTAPSAMNKHPYQLRVKDNTIMLLPKDSATFTQIDTGIAAWCFSAVCAGEWQWGDTLIWMSD